MELTRQLVEAKAEEYADREPLYPVEEEQIEGLPGAFASGTYGWRDAEWVVRWHYRRALGAYPDAERRRGEERFRRNDFEAVREAIEAVVTEDDVAARLDRLTALDGVDVPVASAFCQFVDPETSLVVGPDEWSVLHEAGVLDRSYPDPPSVGDYEAYLGACRGLTEEFGCDAWTLYRALRRLREDA